MPLSNPYTEAQIAAALSRLGNYRVKRVQQVIADAKSTVPASVMLSLGLRENGLTNSNGGGIYDPVTKKYKPSKTDRGWLQITDTIKENKDWLATVPGCPDGSWEPAAGHSAVEPNYCPTFTDALNYTISEFARAAAFGNSRGVPPGDRLRYCVAAHNAGPTGALNGLKQHGDVDYFTAHGDYSAWVLHYAPVISAWIDKHPNWKV